MQKYPVKHEPVDYSRRKADRRRMGNYLRTSSVRKIAGAPIYGQNVRRRRTWLYAIAGVVFCIGTWFVIF